MSGMKFNIALPDFFGPIELLLYLVRKNEVSILEIPLSKVTNQFLTFLQELKAMPGQTKIYSDLSEFILMASILIRLKLKKLIPTAEEKPTETSVSFFEICEEFERCKKLASILSSLEDERLSLFPRPGIAPIEEELDLIDLMKTFYSLQKRESQELFVEKLPFRLEDRIAYVREKIREMRLISSEGNETKTFLTFFTLLKDAKDIKDAIIIFFALLELAFLGDVKLIQESEFSDILVIPLNQTSDY